jgi:hypothetical protein
MRISLVSLAHVTRSIISPEAALLSENTAGRDWLRQQRLISHIRTGRTWFPSLGSYSESGSRLQYDNHLIE